MLLPPAVPERGELLVKNADDVNRPKMRATQGLRPDKGLKSKDVLDIFVIYHTSVTGANRLTDRVESRNSSNVRRMSGKKCGVKRIQTGINRIIGNAQPN